MKKLFIGVVLFLLMITTAAFSGDRINIAGKWYVEMCTYCTVNGYSSSVYDLVIDEPDGCDHNYGRDYDLYFKKGNLFTCRLKLLEINDSPVDLPYTDCTGAIVNNNIYITFRDGILSGRLHRKGTTFDFVAQNHTSAPSAATSIGVATKD